MTRVFAFVVATFLILPAARAQDVDGEEVDTDVYTEDAEERQAQDEQLAAEEEAERKNMEAERRRQLREKYATRYGVGLRLRYDFLPPAVLELFLDRAGGLNQTGFGVELFRRRERLDIVLGLQYDSLAAEEGYYLEKGDDPGTPGEAPDYVTFDGFGMASLDLTFIWNFAITDMIKWRFGAGLGLGFVLGDMVRQDAVCTPGTTADDLDDRNTTSCSRIAGTERPDEDIPPVVPVVHVLTGLGLQLQKDFGITIDVGFRDVFFAGLSGAYLF